MKTLDPCGETALLERLLKGFILHPEDLKITHEILGGTVNLYVQGHLADTSRMIGKRGAHYRALDFIMRAAGANTGRIIELREYLEPKTGSPESYPAFRPRADWPKAHVVQLLRDTAAAIFKFPQCVKVTATDTDHKTTALEIGVATSEPKHLVSLTEEALTVVFNAIGRHAGRLLFVTVRQTERHPVGQPDSAGGRHCPEITR